MDIKEYKEWHKNLKAGDHVFWDRHLALIKKVQEDCVEVSNGMIGAYISLSDIYVHPVDLSVGLISEQFIKYYDKINKNNCNINIADISDYINKKWNEACMVLYEGLCSSKTDEKIRKIYDGMETFVELCNENILAQSLISINGVKIFRT